MEQLAKSSDLWTDITVRAEDGTELTFPVWLELTYGFDRTHRQMGIVVRGHRSLHASDPDRLTSSDVIHITKDWTLVYVFVSNIMTAQRLVGLMGLPVTAASEVRTHLDAMAHALEPFVKEVFLGQTVEPAVAAEPVTQTPEAISAPAVVTADNVLITRNRDVSGLFRKPSGTCTLEYTLFSEPHVFRAVIAARNGDEMKKAEFIRKDVSSIIRDLNGGKLASEIAKYFDNGSELQAYMVSAVLKLGFAMNTGLAKEAAATTFVTAPAPAPTQETITLPRMAAIGPESFTVFNSGDYFEVEVPA